MKSGRAEILTGLLVLVTIAVGVVFLMMLGRGSLFATGVRFVAYLENSADLRPATAVHFEGQRVGDVAAVEWDASRRAYQIVLRVPPTVPVRTDSQVRLRAVKLLGDQFVEITAGSVDAARAQPGGELTAIPFKAMTEGIDRLSQEFEPVLAELHETLSGLKRVFNEEGVLGDLEGTMKHIRSAARTLEASAKDLQVLLGDGDAGLRTMTVRMNRLLDENGTALRAALADAGDAAKSLRRITGDARQPVADIVAATRRLVATLETTAGKLDTTLGSLQASVDRVAGTATGTLDHVRRLLRDNESDIRAAMLATRAATENFERAAAKVADRPSSLLFDSDDETSKAARERRDFERLLRDRGRANRYGKE